MSEEIIKILDALAEKFGLAINWTSSNVIPYLEQLCGKYINYEMATSVVWLIIGIALLCIGKYGIRLTKEFINKYQKDPRSDNDCAAAFSGIATGIVFLVGICICFQQIFDIVTCFSFPEKIILEELKSIYTSMNK